LESFNEWGWKSVGLTIPVINFNPNHIRFELILSTETMGINPKSRYIVYDALNNRMLKDSVGNSFLWKMNWKG